MKMAAYGKLGGGVDPVNHIEAYFMIYRSRAEQMLRFGILWRKRSKATESKKGNR